MARDKSPFKLGAPQPHAPKDPESLFGDLHPEDENVKHLWAHQADVLRAYAKDHEATPDVALELPTGMGKTLVGLVLAEYRRRKFQNRVVYLCPTRQLAHQVGRQGASYGINAVVLVGPQNAYSPPDYASYATGAAVAVTTYSGLFNINPRLDDANAIVLDDAHAGGDYIAQHWSVEIPRDHEAYRGIVGLFSDVIPQALLVRFREDAVDPLQRRDVYKVPSFAYLDRMHKLGEYLDSTLDPRTKPSYPWSVLREHLHATHLYVSWQSLLIRPLLPLSQRHAPFANARQRIYMSATLGVGGELERLIGVDRIARIPVPENWESQRVGRRFILLPHLGLSREEAAHVLSRAVEKRDRTLVLCPTHPQAQAVAQYLRDNAKVVTLDASAVEESLEPFATAEHAALVLAARYDGIDLPDNSCRQLVLFELPAALNLQERFYVDRLRAELVLRDRMRTRITQAMGRCTRNPRDYAAVLLFGTDLMEFCLRRENTAEMPCELQAEVRFGIANSAVTDPKDILNLLDVFFAQGEHWKQADAAIREMRDKCEQVRDPFAARLMAAAPREVHYLYALWDGDNKRALEVAREVADQLDGPEFANYRAWWLYLASSAAYLTALSTGRQEDRRLSQELLDRAKAAATTSWVRGIGLDTARPTSDKPDELALLAAESVATTLRDAGFFGLRFERTAAGFLNDINSDDPTTFEGAVERLGRFLGFEATRPEGDALPDVIWQLADTVHVVLEAKSQVGTDAPVSVATARQCAGHAGTAREILRLGPRDSSQVVLLCHKLSIHKEAVPQIGDTYVFLIEDLRSLAKEVVNSLRQIRAVTDGGPELVDVIQHRYAQAGLDPTRVIQGMTALHAKKLVVAS
jgi:hypothetical protein